MRDLINLIEATQSWNHFMIYGSFADPTTGQNFFFFRMPAGRVPWSRKIVPALDKLVRSWFKPEIIQQDRVQRSRGRESIIHWHVEGIDPDDWTTVKKTPVSRYQWDGMAIVKLR